MSPNITVSFSYNKARVIQALRYHFLSRREIRLMIILVNVFALLSAVLFYLHTILPTAFLVSSFLWFILMLSFWYILPYSVYKRASTFRDHFTMNFTEEGFSVGNERGSRQWGWNALKNYTESPHFFHLYFDSRSFFLVPKDGAETAALRQLLKAKTVAAR